MKIRLPRKKKKALKKIWQYEFDEGEPTASGGMFLYNIHNVMTKYDAWKIDQKLRKCM